MQYLGGKKTIAKEIAVVLESMRAAKPFYDVFCGSCAVVSAMSGERYANDASPALIAMYEAYRGGWRPPPDVSEDTYKELKSTKDPTDPMTAFAGFGCSFGGKWFAGYARDRNPATRRNFAATAARGLAKVMALMDGVAFTCLDYRALVLPPALVYCDPPYANTTGYASTSPFDSVTFWEAARGWQASGSIVVVSEYEAPEDWREIWRRPVRKSRLAGERVERLFAHQSA